MKRKKRLCHLVLVAAMSLAVLVLPATAEENVSSMNEDAAMALVLPNDVERIVTEEATGYETEEQKEDLTLTGDKVIDGDYLLSKGVLSLDGHDLTVHGNFYIDGGTINLGGGTCTIDGNLIQSDGIVTINEGTLNVDGDYRIQTESTDGTGTWQNSTGVLYMNNDEDRINVGGTFATSSSKESTLTAGTMTVEGNFETYGSDTGLGGRSNPSNFAASEDHVVVLTSSGTPKIYSEVAQAGYTETNNVFANLEIPNTNTIDCDGGYFGANVLTLKDGQLVIDSDVDLTILNLDGQNITVNGNVTLSREDAEWHLDGGSLTVNGNFSMPGIVTKNQTVNLKDGTFAISGNAIQSTGLIAFNKGTMTVGGDYRMQAESSDGSGDWEYGNATLSMKNEEDKLSVGGSFFIDSTDKSTLTAGTVEVGEDFMQYGTYEKNNTSVQMSFRGTDEHKVILTSSGTPKVYLNRGIENYTSVSGFANLEIPNTNTIKCGGGWLNADSLTVKDRQLTIDSDVNILNLGLNGQTLTVNGSVDAYGEVMLAGGSCTVTGDYNMIYLVGSTDTLDLGGGSMTIKGNLVQSGGLVNINKGRLTIGGDYRMQTPTEDGSGNWEYSVGSKLQMQNTEDQLKIEGSFIIDSTESSVLTAGTIEIGGNFEQYASKNTNPARKNFTASGTHEVVLNGEGKQKVLFSSYSDSHFNTLRLTKDRSNYSFNPDPCWNKLIGEDDTGTSGWVTENGKQYWYENGVKQGTTGRGKEIYDPDSDAWYWLDAVQGGAKAVSKDVYQESAAGQWADRADGTGKWVRYDANGHMVKGWQTTGTGTYYFDPIYGTMAKGYATIDGKEYYFSTATGVLERELGAVPANGWKTIDGGDYWYENYIRQGYSVDASYRGKEIYDSASDAWYWLDNIDGGKKAVSKDVYQESEAGPWADRSDGTGKWVRYDANGHMVKGWQTTSAGTYYFDPIYGTMAKGTVTIDGQTYRFDENTGVLK